MVLNILDKKSFAEFITTERVKLGMSQQQLADRAEISRVHLARIECERANITPIAAGKILSVLGFSLGTKYDIRRNGGI
jgi:transcriptional regulator with XRE-family HTH domain